MVKFSGKRPKIMSIHVLTARIPTGYVLNLSSGEQILEDAVPIFDSNGGILQRYETARHKLYDSSWYFHGSNDDDDDCQQW